MVIKFLSESRRLLAADPRQARSQPRGAFSLFPDICPELGKVAIFRACGETTREINRKDDLCELEYQKK